MLKKPPIKYVIFLHIAPNAITPQHQMSESSPRVCISPAPQKSLRNGPWRLGLNRVIQQCDRHLVSEGGIASPSNHLVAGPVSICAFDRIVAVRADCTECVNSQVSGTWHCFRDTGCALPGKSIFAGTIAKPFWSKAAGVGGIST